MQRKTGTLRCSARCSPALGPRDAFTVRWSHPKTNADPVDHAPLVHVLQRLTSLESCKKAVSRSLSRAPSRLQPRSSVYAPTTPKGPSCKATRAHFACRACCPSPGISGQKLSSCQFHCAQRRKGKVHRPTKLCPRHASMRISKVLTPHECKLVQILEAWPMALSSLLSARGPAGVTLHEAHYPGAPSHQQRLHGSCDSPLSLSLVLRSFFSLFTVSSSCDKNESGRPASYAPLVRASPLHTPPSRVSGCGLACDTLRACDGPLTTKPRRTPVHDLQGVAGPTHLKPAPLPIPVRPCGVPR